MAMRTELYPAIEPFASGMLTLDATHAIYWEQSGNPRGTPVLFLHGGPGAGASPTHRRFFDPAFYRIVVFDQRGSGRSTPLGELADNTTRHLVEDIERLRRLLEIDAWLVFGGSWGSTLALAYGEAHPERCLGFILRGIFLCRQNEIDWFLYGMRTVFPEAWRDFSEFVPAPERADLLSAYYRRLIDPDPAVHMPAARVWSRYEGACSTLLPNVEATANFADDRVALGLARMEAHYFVNRIFMPENALLENVGRLRRHTATIVQGRYDMVCPIMTADDLAQAWPEARYLVVPDAGHSALEPGVRAALVAAAERYKDENRAAAAQ
ncbi:MAG: prolyl aminopeptidase [Alphaproteobacteria bacterium]|nr:prolyl aminopeptidase [Alphaproteobacteria bacterium]